MARIRSSGTHIEDDLYEIVRGALGYRWRIDRNRPDLPGKPDLVIPSLSVAIFADGCFYHQCPEHGRVPNSNTDYWEQKLERNERRELLNRRVLRSNGFSVWRFWEHDFKTKAAAERTASILKNRLTRRRSDIKGRGSSISASA
jgi:DNA mismatch endonuclease (patch repair protein)